MEVKYAQVSTSNPRVNIWWPQTINLIFEKWNSFLFMQVLNVYAIILSELSINPFRKCIIHKNWYAEKYKDKNREILFLNNNLFISFINNLLICFGNVIYIIK